MRSRAGTRQGDHAWIVRRACGRLSDLSDDQSARIAALLLEASETHHTVYRIVDGDDPDWASWYADWLINLSELPQFLGTTLVRSELVWLLVNLDKQYAAQSPGSPWTEWYAERIVEHFRPGD